MTAETIPLPSQPVASSRLALEVRSLSFDYPLSRKDRKKGARPRRALDRVDLSVNAGEIFGLLGPNGGGKTTLFKVLSTLASPSEGSAIIWGWDAAQESAQVRRRIGVVFQSPSLDRKLTVEENLIYQGRLYGLRGEPLRTRLSWALKELGIQDRASELVETLSGGMRRRAEIAKSLLHRPDLLLMDEPTTGLDPGARRDFWSTVAELKGQGMTLLVTTHLMEEAERCDRVAILNEGKIVAMGSPRELKEEIGGDVVTVRVARPEPFSRKLNERFHLDAVVMEEEVRIETERGPEFVPELLQAFPDEVEAVTVSKPTLEDVFVHRTGHRFWKDSGHG